MADAFNPKTGEAETGELLAKGLGLTGSGFCKWQCHKSSGEQLRKITDVYCGHVQTGKPTHAHPHKRIYTYATHLSTFQRTCNLKSKKKIQGLDFISQEWSWLCVLVKTSSHLKEGKKQCWVVFLCVLLLFICTFFPWSQIWMIMAK